MAKDSKTTDKTTADDAKDDAKSKADTDAGASSDTSRDADTEQDTYTRSDVDRIVNKAIRTFAERQEERHKAALDAKERELGQERLKEQGEYKKLYEEKDDELIALRAEIAASKFRGESHEALVGMGLPEPLVAALLGARDGNISQTLKEITTAGEGLKAAFDEVVKTEVTKRLETGEPPPAGTTSTEKDITALATRAARTGREEDRAAYERAKADAGVY